MIDREMTSCLTTLAGQLFVDATVTQRPNMFSSRTNFLNTEYDKASAASQVGARWRRTGREETERDGDHRQKTWDIFIPDYLLSFFGSGFINGLLNITSSVSILHRRQSEDEMMLQ